MGERISLIATLTTAPSSDGRELGELPPGVEWLEVRADLVGDLDADWLRDRFRGKLLYALRSRSEGGGFEGSLDSRSRRLTAALPTYDLVDLEGGRDLSPDLLAAIPSESRLISWHGPATNAARLKDRFDTLAEVEAALYKLVPLAAQSGDEVPTLEFLLDLGRRDVVAFAAGPVGMWTRLIAPYLGAPVAYGCVGENPGAPGQPSIGKLCTDFGLPELPEIDTYFGIVGNPVAHSLSPRLHNRAYRALGVAASYLPFHTERFGEFWIEVVEGQIFSRLATPLRGLSVTAPFKAAALAVAGASSPLAQGIESANTLVRRDGVWEADTTDPEGVVGALIARQIPLAKRRVAVVGCGGAGRAAAAGLVQAQTEVTLVNRSEEQGQRAAETLEVPFVPLGDFTPEHYDVLVNATPLGQRPDDEPPFDVQGLPPGTVVVDLAYGSSPTALVARAKADRLVVIDGLEVLVYQALGQFRMMTGRELPVELAQRLLAAESWA